MDLPAAIGQDADMEHPARLRITDPVRITQPIGPDRPAVVAPCNSTQCLTLGDLCLVHRRRIVRG